jgi:hypothetical protein
VNHLLRLRGVDAAVLVRRGLVALTVIGIVATAFELATEHHWNGIEQLVPWVALVLLAVAVALLLVPGGRGVPAARVLGVLVLGASVYGVLDHILVNYESGALDQRYSETWETLPAVQRWWLAATKTVGPAPTLAAGVVGHSALLLLLASIGGTRREELELLRADGHGVPRGRSGRG